MTWLDRVEGCACCLASTANVSPCYLAAKGCADTATLESCCFEDYTLNPQKGKVSSSTLCARKGQACMDNSNAHPCYPGQCCSKHVWQDISVRCHLIA